ncbi:hypothetical protein ACVW00_000597 [Marmoricola sp. URHA0025 HA25]
MTTYCGFDLEKVQQLQRALADTPSAASGLAADIRNAAQRAEWIGAAAAGVNPHQLGLDRTEPGGSLPGLTPIAEQAADLAAEVRRRLTHLKSCQSLVADGFTFTGDEAFQDLPPIDAARLLKARDDLVAALDKDGLERTLNIAGVLDEIHGLNAGETDALVAALSDDQLDRWEEGLDLARKLPFGLVPPGVFDGLADDLFTRLGAEQRVRVTRHLPCLQPPLDDDHAGHPLAELPPADIDAATVEDINQGEIGDCWFLASIAAEMTGDPDFVRNHMVANDNGTYTVTFYKDGKPVEVTVDSSVPYDGSSAELAHGDPGWGRNGPSWVAIYEKAFARFKGGYGDIEGGFGDQGMEALTGRDADRHDSDDLSFDDIARNLRDGTPMTAGSKQHTTGHLWWKDDKEKVEVGDDTVVSLHEYTVVGVDLGAHPPTVRLRNPWGSGGSVDEFITMTEDEFHDHFNELSVG